VGGVGGELALGGEGGVQAGQHRVEGVGQLLQLILGAGQLDAARQVGDLDVAGHRGDAADGAQHPAGDHPADAEAGHEQHPKGAEGVVAQLVQGPGVDHPLQLPEGDRLVALVAEADELLVAGGVRLVAQRHHQDQVDGGDHHRGQPEQHRRVQQRVAEADRPGPFRQAVDQPAGRVHGCSRRR
jgi:hypothetical protein